MNTVVDILAHGVWIVLPILLCLVATVLLILNGFSRTTRDRIGSLGHEQTLRALFRQTKFPEAEAFCQTNPSALAKVLRVGLGLIGEGQQSTTAGLTVALAMEELRLHTRFSYLRALAICTPLLGILGTLLEIMMALMQSATNPTGFHHALGGALLPSILGLFVGIVAAAAFYVLRERASAAMLRLKEIVQNIFLGVPYDSFAGVDVRTGK